jgi:ParB-like chromosome segregation protein Spo0J
LEKLGTEKVTCALKLFESEKHRALAGLAENINREDLHFLDKADGYGLLAQQGMSTGEVAALLDADTRTVGKYLRAAAWDHSIKQRIRDMGSKATTRFLLNALAAGERTTAELHAMIDRFNASFGSPPAKSKPPTGAELKRKLGEFCQLAGYSDGERAMIEKALRYLGYLG